MEMLDTLSAVLTTKGHTVHSVSPAATVLEAVRKMNGERIGALLVCADNEVVGILTERDVLIRVVDEGRDPTVTAVSDVMTREVVAVKPSMTVEEAMAVVTERRCRHLPVMDGSQLVGLVSIGDLTQWMSRNQEIHIQDLVNFITDKYPR
jgi:CBS domain-containing protein